MTKAQLKQETTGKWAVRDRESGRFLEVRGADAMKSSKLPLMNGLDLTRPIAEQVLERTGAKPRKRSGKA
jgi:hypothetical protein